LRLGYNAYGQTNVPAGLSNVVAIAAGGYSSLALRNNGTVVAWGPELPPTVSLIMDKGIVPTGLSNVVAIAAGDRHSLALFNDGRTVIVRQPVSQTVLQRIDSVSECRGRSSTTSNLQWQLNGTNLDGATNSYLVFTKCSAKAQPVATR